MSINKTLKELTPADVGQYITLTGNDWRIEGRLNDFSAISDDIELNAYPPVDYPIWMQHRLMVRVRIGPWESQELPSDTPVKIGGAAA